MIPWGVYNQSWDHRVLLPPKQNNDQKQLGLKSLFETPHLTIYTWESIARSYKRIFSMSVRIHKENLSINATQSDVERAIGWADIAINQQNTPAPLKSRVAVALDDILTNIVSYGVNTGAKRGQFTGVKRGHFWCYWGRCRRFSR
jgi:hypothetical protein